MLTWLLLDNIRGLKFRATGLCFGAVAGMVVVTPAAGEWAGLGWVRLLPEASRANHGSQQEKYHQKQANLPPYPGYGKLAMKVHSACGVQCATGVQMQGLLPPPVTQSCSIPTQAALLSGRVLNLFFYCAAGYVDVGAAGIMGIIATFVSTATQLLLKRYHNKVIDDTLVSHG
jgi:hypothetical protein